jgi:hypothetical protein
MGSGDRKLPPEAFKPALALIAGWQQAPDQPVACPVCGAPGFEIVDRSARPYTAWFGLTCGACGLADTITYPLGGAGGS